ncbi:MAG: tail fiber domain-containing protein [Bacteroidales bacterium]|nr:tail fiber domain-containing protein [Bacteroidales bacterium]
MKKTILFFMTVVLCIGLNAQIKVNSYGNVGIKATPSSTYSLNVSGSSYFSKVGIGTSPSSAYSLNAPSAQLGSLRLYGSLTYDPGDDGEIIFDNNGGEGRIRPGYNMGCYIGSYYYQFKQIWTYKLYVNRVEVFSDERLKEKIEPCKNLSEKIKLLKPVTFDFISDAGILNMKNTKTTEEIIGSNKNRIGFLAQDVQEVFPNLVRHNSEYDIYTINYTEFIPILTSGLQEVYDYIDVLENENKSQKMKIEELEKKIDLLANNITGDLSAIEMHNTSSLGQNSPNPFTEDTRIEYYLADEAKDAVIYIYDMNGAQLKSIPLHLKGNGNVILNGGDLKAGMYLYTLITDGRAIDTKTMILTK